jgi:hypothetical protein
VETDTFAAMLTAEIPAPIVEAGVSDTLEGPLPRSLAQAAGEGRAMRGLALVLGVLLLQIAAQGLLLARLSKSQALVVYQAGSQSRLVRR